MSENCGHYPGFFFQVCRLSCFMYIYTSHQSESHQCLRPLATANTPCHLSPFILFLYITYHSAIAINAPWVVSSTTRHHIIGHHYHHHICPLSFPSLAIVIHIVPVSLGSGMDRGDRWRDLSHHEDVTPARPTPGAKTTTCLDTFKYYVALRGRPCYRYFIA